MTGNLSPRLERMYAVVKPDARLPVIVRTTRVPDAAMLAAARGTGAVVGSPSRLGAGYSASATEASARAVAALPDTVQVVPDEPVGAFLGAR